MSGPQGYVRATRKSDDGTAPARPRRGVSALLRTLAGLPKPVDVEGVRYRPKTHEPLRRALSTSGSGSKVYDVRFPTGDRMRVRATADRVYADLHGSERLDLYRTLGEDVKPGLRALDLSCGTGAGSAWLATRVGPAGAVVGLETDNESVRYARRRYPNPHCAYELADATSLEGEPDGGFDVIALVASPGQMRQTVDRVAPLLLKARRLLAPGGLFLIAGTHEKAALDEAVKTVFGGRGGPEGSLRCTDPAAPGPYEARFRRLEAD